jgi:hypothetical protein
MNRPNKGIERARAIYENHMSLLTVIAVLVGLVCLLSEQMIGERSVPSAQTIAKLLLKDFGTFLLVTFLSAFIYENFVNYRNRQEFREDLEDILRNTSRTGIHAVFNRRPTVAYKAKLLESATVEVIEYGTALNTFKNYLVTNMTFDMASDSLGYRDLFEQKLKEGIHFTCLMVDPDFAATAPIAEIYPGLAEKIRASLVELLRVQAEIDLKGYKGKFTICTFHYLPAFAAICVDPSSDRVSGRLLLSPYIHGSENSRAPAYEIHKSENEDLFAVYTQSIIGTKDSCQVAANSQHKPRQSSAVNN